MLPRKILIMGLPGSGKTTLAKKLAKELGSYHVNGDEVRQAFQDNDFSEQGRLRQATRMRGICDHLIEMGVRCVIADFVCPTSLTRNAFGIAGCYIIWMNTVQESRFKDTDKIFEKCHIADYSVHNWQQADAVPNVLKSQFLPNTFNPSAPSGLMIGRFQPFHDGHATLAREIIRRHGQVTIAVRQHPDSKIPFEEVKREAEQKLGDCLGKFTVLALPHIVSVCYGRDVGYALEEIRFGPDVEGISGTAIRAGKL